MDSSVEKNPHQPSFPISNSGMVERVAMLARDMRRAGAGSSLVQALEAVRALNHVGISSRRDVRNALRATLASSPMELLLFDYFFETHFSSLDRTPPAASQESWPRPGKSDPDFWPDPSEGPDGPDEDMIQEITLAGSLDDSGTHTDFASLEQAEAEEMLRRVRELARALAYAMRRRQKAIGRVKIDFRRTFRRSLQTGGEPVDLMFRGKKHRPDRLLVLGDVSGSMEIYTRFLLAFVAGLTEVLSRTEVFLFSTRPKRITPWLKSNLLKSVIQPPTADKLKTGGGTDIGGSFLAFLNGRYSTVLGPKTRVLIVSDGWDRGDPNDLEKAMKRFRFRSSGVVWLNPLAGDTGYEPLTMGLKAALPYVAAHLPFRNLDDIKRLMAWFARSGQMPGRVGVKANGW